MATNGSQNISTAAAGKVLQGAGVGTSLAFSTPTYPSISGTSRKILVSDGTNIVYSTETWAVPGTAGKILRSDGTNWAASTPTYPNAASTAGKVLVSDGTNLIMSTPTFPNASATSGKFIQSDGTNWIASTPTLPTSAGTANKILRSDGTNYVESTPTFPASASATSRKIIVSDGTNWVASTETYATPSTSGNVMTSDGTNWTSAAAPGAGLQLASIVLTSLQVKALRATPIQIVAAQGAGTVIVVVGAVFSKKFYGGTNVWVTGASQAIDITYGSTGTVAITDQCVSSTGLANTSTSYYYADNASPRTYVNTEAENLGIYAINLAGSEVTGNAANDNTVTVTFVYRVVTI